MSGHKFVGMLLEGPSEYHLHAKGQIRGRDLPIPHRTANQLNLQLPTMILYLQFIQLIVDRLIPVVLLLELLLKSSHPFQL